MTMIPMDTIPKENALIVIESEPIPIVEVVEPPPDYGKFRANDVLILKKEGVENAPDSKKPFYIVAGDGLFLNRDTVLGRAFVKQKYYPSHLPRLGGEQFGWIAPIIPKEIFAQIVHFFTRIYDKYKAEAEVILLMDLETKEWEIFVPFQKVSGGSVESVFEPKDIPEGKLIVGSMHSHCDFSAFHSGTDMNDASQMDGVHFTIGNLKHDHIQVVSMVMISGSRFNYKPSELADISDLMAADAPEDWDEKVTPTVSQMSDQHKSTFEKYGKKPTTSATYRSPYYTSPYSSVSDDGDEYGLYGYDGWWNNRDSGTTTKPEETSSEIDNKRMENIRPDITERARLNSPHWEDFVSDDLIDDILESGVFTDQDFEEASLNPDKAADKMWWRAKFMVKMGDVAKILDKLGMQVDYTINMKGSSRDKASKRQHNHPKVIEKTATQLDLLPEDLPKSLSERLEDDGFTILEVVKDGSGAEHVVIDVSKVYTD